MSWYQVDDFEEYLLMLALYHNTHAIEAHKARIQYRELQQVYWSIEAVQIATARQIMTHSASS